MAHKIATKVEDSDESHQTGEYGGKVRRYAALSSLLTSLLLLLSLLFVFWKKW